VRRTATLALALLALLPATARAAAAPDPFVLDVHGAHRDYWAFVTGAGFPILRSSDLRHWRPAGTAFAARPAWVVPTGDWHPWAPSVTEVGGGYVMYYAGLSRYGVNCVGVATAVAPGGPYTDLGPLSDAAGHAVGCGSIDPSPFVDADGRAYLYVSTRPHPRIAVIPLTPDRLHAAGPRRALLSGHGGVVEGPAVFRHRGTYYLLYSHGGYRGPYGMAYATAASPLGPFRRGTTILAQTRRVFSPGGGDVPVSGPHGGTFVVYHGRTGGYGAVRTLRVSALRWRRGRPDVPVIAGP
jgi:beta-xylosidase